MEARFVVVETPFSGNVELNVKYARACMRNCIVNHGEIPFASHLLYTQLGILDDSNPAERVLGIKLGLELVEGFDLTAVYTDLGISEGMRMGISAAARSHRKVAYRSLGPNWQSKQSELIAQLKEHPFALHHVSM